jgi:hypothetical protein
VITQPKKWPGALAAIVIAIVVFKNPAGAADLVNHVITGVNTFAAHLHIGA